MNFDDAFNHVVGVEGGLSMDPHDAGNWTGGHVGVGVLKGTKYGISAASYPTLDISSLTVEDARAIYKRDYWDKLGGDFFDYGVALCLFDYGVNAGIDECIRVAQRALGLQVDGVEGPVTKRALASIPAAVFVPLFTKYRIDAYHSMSGFDRYGDGWIARANQTAEKALA